MTDNNYNVKIRISCSTCRTQQNPIYIKHSQLKGWMNGLLIQSAMPHLSADERELLISGTCGKCWNQMFSGGA